MRCARRAARTAVAALLTLLLASLCAPAAGARAAGTGSATLPAQPEAGVLSGEGANRLSDPIDPSFLTGLPFSARSFWIQPWRAYLDTWPASHLLEAIGFDFPPKPSLADATAHMLHDSGFKLARLEVGWPAMSFSDPSAISSTHIAGMTTRLTALREHGVRPLIVLNANSGAPGPLQHISLETVTAAPAGAQTVALSAASAALVVPGKTGFNKLTFGGNPDDLVTSVNAAGVATLSRPLLAPLPAGTHPGTTLRFAPFQAPTLANGQPNPVFQETMEGWLQYVDAVCRTATSILGKGGFDIEVWNELSFGSQFLNYMRYYAGNPGEPEEGEGGEGESQGGEGEEEGAGSEGEEAEQEEAGGEGEEGEQPAAAQFVPAARAMGTRSREKRLVGHEVKKALLRETVAYITNPANGFAPGVAITNGFASQSPFPSGADAPPGLTALSKHPYTTQKFFPGAYALKHGRPLDALGERDTLPKSILPLFLPTYQSLFPEYWLTGTSTETLIRDIAPFNTDIYGSPHGRLVGPPGESPVQKWVTEFDMRPRGTIVGPDEKTPQTGAAATLSHPDRAHFQAKIVLRSFIANVSKGISREYVGSLSLLEGGFYSAVEALSGAYPGDAAGGETMVGLHALLGQFQGPGPGGAARQLALDSIVQTGNHAQFSGDGTAAHPDLYDRDVLAVFPYQSSPTRFVIPFYVMTRDLLTLYQPSASPSDVHRFDLPGETFRITLDNLPQAAAAPSVSAYDPLLDSSTPARLISHEGRKAVFQILATDYPRVLTIDYTPPIS